MRSRALLVLAWFVAIVLGGCGSSTDEAAPASCAPKTCEDLAKTCGAVDDGCGNAMSCGTCPVGETCGGGGVANVCGPGDCTPRTCAELGKNCGKVSDGCASSLECGSCSGDETCGGGGVANVCGAPVATDAGPDGALDASSDASDDTGATSDAPDAVVDTGEPDAVDTGEPDAVVDTGEPDAVVDTGEPDAVLDSGEPDVAVDTGAADTTVDTGEADVAVDSGVVDTGAPDIGAPDTGAPDTGAHVLGLNVETYVQTGGITLNGGAPTRTCSSASPATVRFVEKTKGYELSIAAACNDAFSFSGQIYPGTYAVYVRGTSYSNLPQDAWFLVDEAFVVTSARSGLVFDVRTHVQSGGITLNGAPPTRTCSSASPATVRFVEEAKGYDLSIAATCNDAFSFSGQVYPGTYKVYVRGTSYSNLPQDAWYLIDAAFVVSGATSGLVFDVRTYVQSGGITLNGAPPTRTCSSASPATVRFVEKTKGYELSIAAACNDAFSFSGQIYPGTYEVYVRGTSYSNLPQDAWYLVHPSFVVSAAASGLVFDVKTFALSGGITLNGGAPTRTCSSASPATVRFVEKTKGYELSLAAACNDAFSFSGQIYPGAYEVYVRGTSYSNLPQDAWYQVHSSFIVSAPASGLAFDVKTFAVSGGITLNGGAPTRTCSSASPATVRFVEKTKGYELSIAAACNDAFAFTGQLYPGTYRVLVRGTSYSNLPQDAWYVVDEALDVSAGKPGLAFDVVTRAVSGSITLNGAPPTRTCSSASPATVRFVDESRGYDLSLPATCTTAFAFSGQLYPGTYRVLVRGTSYSNLPQDAWYVALPSFVVP